MEIEVKKKVNVPISPWCGNCIRREKDSSYGEYFCTLHNSFLHIHLGKFLKCRECYLALYEALEQED